MLYVAVGLLLIIAIGAAFYVMSRAKAMTPNTYTKATAAPTAGACLNENSALEVIKDRNAIELSAISYLIDVPAGTHVDVKIASHTADSVTGSDRYPSQYGSYNFVLEKENNDWVVTKFQRCNP